MTRLGDLCRIAVGDEDADFWIVRRDSIGSVGRPTRTFDKEKISVKVTKTDVLLPDYLFYAITYLHSTGYFRQLAKGTTGLVSIRRDDVANIPMGDPDDGDGTDLRP